MGATKRLQGDALRRRMEAWGDEWRAVAASTERADRARAEAAITLLYADAGKPAPAFAWVPSPSAGVAAYAFAQLSHAGIVSPWARGDIGNGDNRQFNGLANPFGMEPAWIERLAAAVRERIPGGHPPRQAWLMPVVAAAEGLGFGGTGRVLPVVRQAIAAAGSPSLAKGPSDPPSVDIAAGVLGPAWPQIVELLGADIARDVFVEAVRDVAASVLDSPIGRRDAIQAMQPGQWDVVAPVLAASRDVFGGSMWRLRSGRAPREHQVDTRLEIARSAGPWWALDGLAIVSERPLVIRTDDRGRPHRVDGPAIAWADGLEAFAWHGVAVPPWIIRDPDQITVATIDAEQNVEVRRVLIERFGEERLVREGGAALVSEDEAGRLWSRRIEQQRSWRRTEEPIVMVEVRNSTPEPDGSHKTYFLRVPPAMKTAREAVAWTFGLEAVEYRPASES